MSQVDPNQSLKNIAYKLLKVALFALLLLGFYMLYLDAWVQNKMAGDKWETPVKVYGRTLQLYPGKFANKRDVVNELKLLNYQQKKQVVEPGNMLVHKQFIELYRREFVDANNQYAPKKIRVGFNGDFIAQVQHVVDGQWQNTDMVEVEPLLISRHSDSNNEDRDIINLAMVPEWMVDTLLQVEDRNFYHHHGIAPLAIVRALWANITAGRKVQGGSTLTQQLAKNLLLNDRRKSYIRKFKEALVALILDYRFSKDDILEAYFNEIYLGQDGNKAVHGFSLASQFYFSKPLVELEYHEFALLVAVVKGPSYYNPVKRQQRALARRDLVLQMMVSENIIDANSYANYIEKPIVISRSRITGRSLFPSYMQLVDQELKNNHSDINSNNGLLVFTGLDPVLQSRSQPLFKSSLVQLQKQKKQTNINGAMVSIDLDNGAISALIGDKQADSLGFNRALNANRNIGSLVKPAVYLAALKQPDYSLLSKLSNQAITMKNNKNQLWQPQNYDKTTSESVLLADSLVESKNIPTVDLGMKLGLKTVINQLQQLGVEQKIPQYPSILLGAISMSPLEVAKMYQPFASFGQKLSVGAITSITDGDGVPVWQKDTSSEQLVPYETAYVVNSALTQVTKTGTAKRLGMYYPKLTFAGKTGTTDDLRDSWFVGFDQNKLTAVWVGNDDNSPVELTGSQGALSVFIKLQGAVKSQPLLNPQPNQLQQVYYDRTKDQIYKDECGEAQLVVINKNKLGKIKSCPGLFNWF